MLLKAAYAVASGNMRKAKVIFDNVMAVVSRHPRLAIAASLPAQYILVKKLGRAFGEVYRRIQKSKSAKQLEKALSRQWERWEDPPGMEEAFERARRREQERERQLQERAKRQ